METVAEWRVVQPVPCRNASELNASNPLQSPSWLAAGSQWKSKLSQAESGLAGASDPCSLEAARHLRSKQRQEARLRRTVHLVRDKD